MTSLRRHRTGVSIVGVLVAILCIVVLIAIIVPIFGERAKINRADENRWRLKQIHQSMLVFANDNDDIFPTPGLINRSRDPQTGEDHPGAGPENVRENTTANLFSALIAQEFFNYDLLISPYERNPVITECATYDYVAYNPQADIYWDRSFVADLETGSNVSYAHMPIFGERAKRFWRNTSMDGVIVLGNRGPCDGVASADSYSCLADGRWIGMFRGGRYSDKTLEFDAGRAIGSASDNPFNFDPDVVGQDNVIAFTKEMTEAGPVLQHD